MYEIEGKPVPLENQTSPIEAVNVTSSSESVPSDAISVGPLQEARMHEFFPGDGKTRIVRPLFRRNASARRSGGSPTES